MYLLFLSPEGSSVRARLKILGLATIWILTFFLIGPILALADSVPPDAHTLVMPQTQLVAAIFGAIVPAVTYLLNNRVFKLVSEPVKALVLVLFSAAAGVLAQLLDAGSVPLDWNTAQIVGTAVVLAFLAHMSFWQPSGVAAKLRGAGRAR